MRPKEILLLIVLVAAGIVFTHVRTGGIDGDWFLGDLEGLGGRAFTFQETQVLEPPLPLPASLTVENSHGDVIVQGSATDKIIVTLEKKIWRREERQAREVADGLHLRLDRSAAGLMVGTNRDDFTRRNFETNIKISVPASFRADIRNSHGLVRARGLASAVVAAPHGEVTLEDVAGDAKVENTYEDVMVSGVRGACDIRSSHSDVSALAVDGDVTIDHHYGGVTLRHAGGKAVVVGAHSEVVAEDIAGAVDVRNSYDKVTLRRVGPAKITGHHSDVEASGVNGGLEIITSYAEASVGAVTGALRVTGRSVRLSGSDLSGGDIYIATSYEPVDLAAFSGKATILVSHGEVTLTPRPLAGPIEVRCDNSPVTLHWPAGGPYPFEARARSGRIRWGLDGPARVEESGGVNEIRAFSDATNKPGIVLATSYDDIDVEKD